MHPATTTHNRTRGGEALPSGRRGGGNAGGADPGAGRRDKQERRRPARQDVDRAALDLIARRGAEIVATARRYAATPEDAEDAYQRGLEILLRKAPTTREEELVPWLKTVVKHEAFALRRQRVHHTPSATTASLLSAPRPRRSLTTRRRNTSGCARARRRWASSNRRRSGRSCSGRRATATGRSARSPDGPTPKSTAA